MASRYKPIETEAPPPPAAEQEEGATPSPDDDDDDDDDESCCGNNIGSNNLSGCGGVAVGSKVEVVAPSDLPGGYEFATVVPDGHHVIVAVPPDGVRRYEQFEATVTVVTHFSSSPLQPGDVVAVNADEESFEHGRKMHGIPTGTWRDGLCDCGTLGCCHPVCCCTLWCAPVALGQILTRLRLDCCGRPPPPSPRGRGRRSSSPVCSPCIACAYLYIPLLLLVGGFTMAIDSYDATLQPRQQLPWEYHLLYYARLCLVLVWSLFFVLAVARTRSWIRRQYGIPEDTACEGGCEDCCCACFCTGCTICQMARHTANFRDFNATCCTENGLEGTAPDVV